LQCTIELVNLWCYSFGKEKLNMPEHELDRFIAESRSRDQRASEEHAAQMRIYEDYAERNKAASHLEDFMTEEELALAREFLERIGSSRAETVGRQTVSSFRGYRIGVEFSSDLPGSLSGHIFDDDYPAPVYLTADGELCIWKHEHPSQYSHPRGIDIGNRVIWGKKVSRGYRHPAHYDSDMYEVFGTQVAPLGEVLADIILSA
jgi:hypothetical protein